MHRHRRFLSYVFRQWPRLLLVAALTSIGSIAAALQPWPMKILVDYALGHRVTPAIVHEWIRPFSATATPPALIAIAALASLALFALNAGVDAVSSWTWTVAGQRMIRDLAEEVFQRLGRSSLAVHHRRRMGDSLETLTYDTWAVYNLADGILIEPAQRLFTFATVFAVAWRLHPRLAVCSVVTAPLVAGATFLFGAPLKRRARGGREAQARLLSFVHETLSAMPVVQAFATEAPNARRFQDLAADAVVLSQRQALVGSGYGLVTGAITTIGSAAIVFVGGSEVLAGTLTVGSFIVFLSYLRIMQTSAENLLATYATLKPLEASLDRVWEILDEPADVQDPREPKSLPTGGVRGHVRFESVTFGHEPGKAVLRDVTIEAAPGETVALVGATGSGKSTLVSLIPRFHDPWEGRVTLDGIDVREIRLRDLRSQIALVFHDAFLFPTTIAANIAVGRADASREEIVAAARAANAADFIRRLPDGYDTIVAEGGATLSGGERQRLAIARAILRNAPVLILDEPTSALDAETEAAILESLERLRRGRTTLVIAHRLSTVRNADRIVVVDGGRVVETGTHESLLARDGAYRRFHIAGESASSAQVA
jgi:ATP-binding cassette subfamily B protein/subfamily B ATP-binding cassette protein MsbA